MTDQRSLILKVAADKLGLDGLDESACGIERLRHGARDEIWRVIVAGDGKSPTFDPDTVLDESVETRTAEVSERELREVDR